MNEYNTTVYQTYSGDYDALYHNDGSRTNKLAYPPVLSLLSKPEETGGRRQNDTGFAV